VRIKCEDGEDPAGVPDEGTGAVGAAGDVGAGWAGGGMGLGSGCCARRTGERNSAAAATDTDNAKYLFVEDANKRFVAMSLLPLLLADYQVGSIQVTLRATAIPEDAVYG
jgi:hypothetical protein